MWRDSAMIEEGPQAQERGGGDLRGWKRKDNGFYPTVSGGECSSAHILILAQ